MKKLLLLLAAGATGFGATAQNSVVFTPGANSVIPTTLPAGMTKERLAADFQTQRLARQNQSQQAAANKGVRTATRVYNYVDLLITQTPTTVDNQGFPYMWGSYNGKASYSSGYDTINTASFGQIIQPWYNKWNSAFGFPGTPWLKNDAAYKLDTVKIYGVYQRNVNKPNVVDTMMVSLFYGNGAANSNIEVRNIAGGTGTLPAEYGLANMLITLVPLDSLKITGRQGTAGTTMIQRKIPMTVTPDTTEGGLDIVRVPANMNIPAGNMVGMTFTFKTGDPAWTPYDTVLLSTGGNQITPKFNLFRPHMFEQNASAYPTYYADSNFNNGMFHLFPTEGDIFYLPMFFFTAASTGEFPNADFIISGSEFENNNVSVKQSASVIGNVSIFPNPSRTEVTIPVTLTDAADVTVSITNTMGQVIKTQVMGKVAANTTVEAKFRTSELAAGVYFYTVDAAGQRVTNRFAVAH